VEIECLPDEIPETFTVVVTELMIGQGKRASDVELSGSMKLVSDPTTVIAHIVAMRAEEVVAPVEGAVPVAEAVVPEPEVVKKGKKEEEAEQKEKGKKK
jgi:large subunit ribosomal protein L25